MDLKTQIEQFFNDLKGIMQILAPICAFIGLVGSGVIYMGSSWPVVGRLKRNNPEMMDNMFIGMAVLLAAGTISSLIVFG